MRNFIILWLQTVLLLFVSSNTVAADLSPQGIKCDAPTFSEENIIAIVEMERRINPDVPKKGENSDISVRRNRCHYVYSEFPSNDSPISVVINQYGQIVDFIAGRSSKSLTACPQIKMDNDAIKKRVAELRSKDASLPPRAKNSQFGISRTRCLYSYFEKPGPKNKDGKTQTFIFDYYGDLYAHYETD